MRNKVSWLGALIVAAAAAHPARAQDPAPPSLAEELAAVRPADLAGEAWFGLYHHGKSVGTLHLSVAPEASGLKVRVRTSFTLGGVQASLEEEARLASPLSPRRLRQVTREGEQPPAEVVVEREGDGLVVRTGEHRWRVGPADAVVVGPSSRLVLARALQQAGVTLGRHEAQELSLEQERLRPLEVRLEALPGRPGARRVTLTPVADPAEAWTFDVDAEGRIESFGRRAEPGLVYLRAADEADARRDRPELGQPPAGSPRAVVLEYLRGLVRGDPARVEAAINWPALYESLGAADVHSDVAAFKRSFLEGLPRAAEEMDLDPDDVEALGPTLGETLSPDGARAWVTIPGEDHRVRLGRASGGEWKIQALID